MVLGQLAIYTEKDEIDFYVTPHSKINSRGFLVTLMVRIPASAAKGPDSTLVRNRHP